MEKDKNFASAILDNAGTILAAIPALGFVLAASKEASFFYFLGVNMGQVFDTSDMIRSSALNVLPAVPALLISLLFFTSTSLKASSEGEGTVILVTSNNAYYLMLAVTALSAVAFFLLGAAPEIAVWSIAILSFLVVIRETVRLLKPIGLTFRVYAIGMTLLIVIGHFAVSGIVLAFKVRSGDLDSFPIFVQTESEVLSNNQLRLVRRFSEGQLIVDYQGKLIHYLPNSANSQLTYDLRTEPFRGALCYLADWCWASGWLENSGSIANTNK